MGIGALHEGLTQNKAFKLKILVGLEAEEHAGKIAEFAGEQGPETTDEERRKNFLQSLRSVMRGKEIDTERYYERVTLFIELVKSGQIELRKTRDPNHAKLYHFSLNESWARALGKEYCWIMGSSNMTRPGLLEQNELNVQLLDVGGEEAKMFFDVLWETAVPLTDDPATKAKIIELVSGDESLMADVTPFEAYALVLKSYLEHRELVDRKDSIVRIFGEPKDENGDAKYRTLGFQIDAVNQALSILKEYNGVIIADVVGLGKSVIGSVLGKVNRKRGVVIAPPGLVGDRNTGTGWWGYLEDFGLNDWVAVSRGKMDEVLSLVNRQRDFEIVVVDEAHYFRNQDSEDYHFLSQTCRGKQVVLLTATPYSNRPSDMLALLKLFSPARQSLLTPDGNLEGLFRVYQVKYSRVDYVLKNLQKPERAGTVEGMLKKLGIQLELRSGNVGKIRHEVKVICKKLAQEIRQVIEPVMIRRNRLDLKGDLDYAKEVGENLPTMHDPVEQFYQLSTEQSAFYDQVISEYFGEDSDFSGAIYQPSAYTPVCSEEDEDAEDQENITVQANTQQRNMYKFIRRLLVHRFESSFGAFAKTLDNLIRAHKNVKRLAVPAPLGKGIIVLDRSLMEKLLGMEDASDDEVDDFLHRQEELADPNGDHSGRRNLQIYRVSEDFDDEGRERFNRDVQSDINLLEKVRNEVGKLDLVANDPKARKLIAEIRSVLDGDHPALVSRGDEPERKVIVFSEFSDTVEHLREYLDAAFPAQVLTIRSLSKEVAATVRKNFDGACHAGLQQDHFKVLLATDKMSEGFNLNRAGLVINYDIPWNPTRVIQRVGRINRIGTKVFEDLYLFNFFPSEQGETLHNVRQIATNKMFMIHRSIGEDSRIFDTDEEPTPAGLFEKLSRNPDELEEESFLTQAKREWAEIQERYPEVAEKVRNLPGRVKTTQLRDPMGTYLFARKGMTLFVLCQSKDEFTEDGIVHLSVQEAIGSIKCSFDALRNQNFSKNFWSNYEDLQQSLTDRRHGASPGATSLIAKARNALIAAIAKGSGGLFVKILLDDLQNHGTLADRTLRKIIEAAGEDKLFEKCISQLKQEMGGDYLELIKDKLPPNEIVIAIEHQRLEG